MAGKRGLGRGLEALFGETEAEYASAIGEKEQEKKEKTNNKGPVELDIIKVYPNPDQPRKIFDRDALAELATSIARHGVISPIIVKPTNDGYMIVAGERRWRAARIAEKETIPAIVKDFDEQTVKEVALIENLQREDLNPVEAARGMRSLMETFDYTQEQVAEALGMSRPAVANLLRLLNLSSEVLMLIEKNLLSAGHARCLVVVENRRDQERLAHHCLDKKMSVREFERFVKEFLKPKEKVRKPEQSIELRDFCERLTRYFGTKVTINGSEQKGKIVIDYYNSDDLDRIFDIISR